MEGAVSIEVVESDAHNITIDVAELIDQGTGSRSNGRLMLAGSFLQKNLSRGITRTYQWSIT